MVTSVLALIIILIVIPYCIGLLPASFIEDDRRTVSAVYVFGFAFSLALFELISVPVIIMRGDGFPLIVALYLGVECAFAMIGLIVFNFAVRKKPADHAQKWLKREHRIRVSTMTHTTEEKILWLLAALSVVFQLIMYVRMQSFDGDDAYYVVQSLLSDETDTLYRIKPYTGLTTSMDLRHALASVPVWIAYIARVSGIHSTIIAHSVIGLLLIVILYLIYYNCGVIIFNGDSKKLAAFMLFISFLYIFGNVSIYTRETFMLTRTWQGKSILANLVIAAVIWLLLSIFYRDEERLAALKYGEEDEHLTLGYWIMIFSMSIVAAMCSTAGVFLIGLLIGAYGTVLSLWKRDIQIALKLMITCVPLVVYGAIYMIM